MKWIKYTVVSLSIVSIALFIALRSIVLAPPPVDKGDILNQPVKQITDSLMMCQDDWLKTNDGGISELYISGKPFEMGVKNGKLTQKLAGEQEKYFFEFINTIIPSKATIKYLKYFISYFNKDLDEYIPLSLRKEIYGVSLFASDEFDFVGDKYHRILNYHAAHDIGHTIQNMNLVNCTAFSVQDERTKDGSLIIGRNLDFSAGNNFARNKLVVFCNPDSGFKFAYVSWGGMIGVLSGMNEHGLTVTLNSAKSGVPLSAKTPVSLISREVLQRATNISEAYAIIKKYDSFVSESFFIGSAIDNKAVVIEKSLDKVAIYDANDTKLVLTNHFQSQQLKDSELNIEGINEGCSLYRMQRTNELIDSIKVFDVNHVVDVLRNKQGLNNKSIGLGNEAAINQLICHHSVVFKPYQRLMWVSKFPYQENDFVAYDLNKVFSESFNVKEESVSVDSLRVNSSVFYKSGRWEAFEFHKEKLASIKEKLNNSEQVNLDDASIDKLLNENPDYYYTYYILGQYFESNSEYNKALSFYNKSLDCKIPRLVDQQQVLNRIEKLKSENEVK